MKELKKTLDWFSRLAVWDYQNKIGHNCLRGHTIWGEVLGAPQSSFEAKLRFDILGDDVEQNVKVVE